MLCSPNHYDTILYEIDFEYRRHVFLSDFDSGVIGDKAKIWLTGHSGDSTDTSGQLKAFYHHLSDEIVILGCATN